MITLFSDADMSLMRFQFGHDEIFDYAPDYIVDAMAKAFDNNAARLAIAGDDPMMLANEDPDKVGRANKAQSAAYTPVRERITRFNINWNIVAYPGKKWAELVFPDKKPKSAQKKLAKAVFAASRIDVDDPISAWNEHNTNLRTRADWLNENRFFVPDGTAAAMDPYIRPGSYFLALRLRSGESAGSKLTKAQQLGVPILSEADLRALAGDEPAA